MQTKIRNADPNLFPLLDQFANYYYNNELENTTIVAEKIAYIIKNSRKFKENILTIRDCKLN